MINMHMMSSLEPGGEFSPANLTDHSQYVLIPGFFHISSRSGPGSSTTRPAGLSSCTGGITEDGRGRRRATCGRSNTAINKKYGTNPFDKFNSNLTCLRCSVADPDPGFSAFLSEIRNKFFLNLYPTHSFLG
jgi:hypothetical protein